MIQVRDPVELGGQIDENSHGTGFDRVGAFQDGFHRRRGTLQDVLHRRPREPAHQHPVRLRRPNDGNLPLIDPESRSDDRTRRCRHPASRRTSPVLDRAARGQQPHPHAAHASRCSRPTANCPRATASTVRHSSRTSSTARRATRSSSTRTGPRSTHRRPTARRHVGRLPDLAGLQRERAGSARQHAGRRATRAPRRLPSGVLDPRRSAAATRRIGPLYLSAGDLDEAVVTAIVLGDQPATPTSTARAFEKVDAFRSGVLGGMQACQDRISP